MTDLEFQLENLRLKRAALKKQIDDCDTEIIYLKLKQEKENEIKRKTIQQTIDMERPEFFDD